MRKTLSLKRESLAPLTPGEMASVAGASHLCLDVTEACGHASIDQSCPTVPVVPCLSLDCFGVATVQCVGIRTLECPTI